MSKIFIGIDVASNKHDAVIHSENGKIVTEHFSFTNDISGYKKLCSEINSHTEHVHEVIIGLEETGIYSDNISNYLFNCGYIVYTMNPRNVHHYRKSSSLRPTKTDKIDSIAISKYIRSHYQDLNPYVPTLYNASELKSLTRIRFKKLTQRSKCKTEIKRLLSLIFPEVREHFDTDSKWFFEVFKHYKSVSAIAKSKIPKLQSMIRTKTDRFIEANLLKQLAKDTIGSNNSIYELQLQMAISDIEYINNQLDEIDDQIIELMKPYEFLLSVPGIGYITGGMIVGEIGNVNNFESPSSLLAFSGLDPSTYESGKFKGTKSRISKSGSKSLRTALFTATRVACVGKTKPNRFKEKYMKKRLEGKHHYSAICNVAKNMVNVIYKLLNTREQYDYSV